MAPMVIPSASASSQRLPVIDHVPGYVKSHDGQCLSCDGREQITEFLAQRRRRSRLRKT